MKTIHRDRKMGLEEQSLNPIPKDRNEAKTGSKKKEKMFGEISPALKIYISGARQTRRSDPHRTSSYLKRVSRCLLSALSGFNLSTHPGIEMMFRDMAAQSL
jgi:hypothetical protein